MHCTGKLGAGHRRHDFVGEHEIETMRIGSECPKCRAAIIEANRLESEGGQHLFAEQNEVALVIDQQDGLPFAAR